MAERGIYYIEVLGKALTVLDAFASLDQPRLTLQQITTHTGLGKNAVFRILYTLAEHGYVVKRNAEYELGTKVLDLGDTTLRSHDLHAVAGPYLDTLRDQFHETVNLGVLDGKQIRYVDVRESPSRFRLAERIGGSDPLHCTALGKAHLAYLPQAQVRRLLRESGMPRLTPRTITTARALETELARIRAQGYALDNEESMAGAFCVGAPILDSSGAPIAAISVSGPTARFNDAALPAVSKALRAAVVEIGARTRRA